ncbi:hypothetical protein OG937_45605 [Streptomyces sp. NBC_00510]
MGNLYVRCGLGPLNHLPNTARNARLTELRVRAFASVMRELLPFLLGPDRDTLMRKA